MSLSKKITPFLFIMMVFSACSVEKKSDYTSIDNGSEGVKKVAEKLPLQPVVSQNKIKKIDIELSDHLPAADLNAGKAINEKNATQKDIMPVDIDPAPQTVPEPEPEPEPEPKVIITLSGTDRIEINDGDHLSFQPTVEYSGKHSQFFTVTGLPAWATIDSATGLISGLSNQSGIFEGIVITVSDGENSAATPPFTLQVNPQLRLTGNVSSKIKQGANFQFQPLAEYSGNQTLLFSAENLPSWATINSKTGLIKGNAELARTFDNIRVHVTDGDVSDMLTPFSIVVEANQPPTISGELPSHARVGVPYSFTPIVSDAEDDQLSFTGRNFPPWLSVDTLTGEVTGIPTSTGSFREVSLSVTDGFNVTSTYFTSLAVADNSHGESTLTHGRH